MRFKQTCINNEHKYKPNTSDQFYIYMTQNPKISRVEPENFEHLIIARDIRYPLTKFIIDITRS